MRVALKTFCPPRGRPPKTPEEGWCVRQLKRALNDLGYYTPPEDAGITDDNDDAFQDSLTAFRRAQMIPFDDRAGPRSVTERILNEELEDLDPNALYTWRTVGDKKVRDEHAARDGQSFYWSAPPDGEHPGEDYNCRCWAEPLNPSRHVWAEWARKQGRMRAATLQDLAPPLGLNDGLTDLMTPIPLDATNPTWSPFDFIAPGAAAGVKAASRLAASKITAIQLVREAAKRDVSWIRNAAKEKLQHMYNRHSKDFGIQKNFNKKNLEVFKNKLESHIKSSNTTIIEGTYHKRPVTHYYNSGTRINIIRDSKGELVSGWKLTPKQNFHVIKDASLGGNK